MTQFTTILTNSRGNVFASFDGKKTANDLIEWMSNPNNLIWVGIIDELDITLSVDIAFPDEINVFTDDDCHTIIIAHILKFN